MELTANRLGFFVIGAMKSGTTSLHRYLNMHPDLYLPPEKEAPYFSRQDFYTRGMPWYLDEFFSSAKSTAVLGTVSPQYMAFPGIAARIRRECPEARLIAILRDPRARAESHYKMMVRTHGERRSLERALISQLETSSLEIVRGAPDFVDSYVVWGEYGRIIKEYLFHFPRDQLLIVFFDDFVNRPSSTLAAIFRFIGVREIAITERNIRSNSSEGTGRIRTLAANLANQRAVLRLGKHMLPERYKRRIRVWSILNRRSPETDRVLDTKLSPTIRQRLARHFLGDTELLETYAGRVPWHNSLHEEAATADPPTGPVVIRAKQLQNAHLGKHRDQ